MNREYVVKMSADEATSLSMEYFQQPTLVDREKEFRNRFMKKVFNYCDSREDYACEKRIRHSKSEDTKYRMVHENTRNYTSGLDMNSSNVSLTKDGNILKNDFMKNRNFSSWSELDVPGYNNLTPRVSAGSLTNGHDHERGQTNDNDYFDRRRLFSQRPEVTQTLSFNEELRSSGSNQVKQGYPYMSQYDVKMATEEEVAMNLSTEGKYSSDIGTSLTNSPSSVANGDIETHSQGQASPLADVKGTVSAGSSKRKSRSIEEPTLDLLDSLGSLSQHQSLLMLAAQHGLSPQQLQQMLISQQGAAMPPHVQQLLQAQQSVVMQQQQKVQEQALVQLNEQLQLNLLQQSQLVLEKKTNGKQTQQQLQQLALQQQQIVQQIQQIQLQQRQLLLACLMQPFSTQQGVMSSVDMHQAWKDMTASQGSNDDPLKSMVTNGTSLGALNGTSLGMNHLLQGSMLGANGITADTFSLGHMIGQPAVTLKTENGLNPLFRHGVCKWPGCDTECSDVSVFTKHLVNEHTLDDKNTAQARVQMQIVSQLEIQLTREKELLHAMMQHLHTQPQRKNHELTEHKFSEKNTTSPKMSSSIVSPMKSSAGNNSLPVPTPKKQSTLSHMSPVSSGLAPLVIPPQPGLTSIPSCPGSLQSQSQPTTPTGGLGPMRRRVSDKCNLPISAEIQRNRDFYKSTDVRPPFTYASLIRQAIIESENRQLTLNEVYQWFQNTFAYFRRNEATWKNAVRHNLSLHKCFMRVENVKGAVWTVDEVEFYKRRPQKLTGAISSSASFSSDTSIYGDPINASIRAAMEQNPILFTQHMSNGGMSDNGVEDLSMKSYNNSNDSFIKSESPQRDGPGYSEMDLMNYRDESLNNSPRDYSNQGLDLSPKTSSNGSPKSLLPNSIGSNRASPQSRNITSEGVLNETPNGQFVSDMEHTGHHREHYSESKGSIIKQESHDMQMRSADDQSEALNMKVEPKVENDRKVHDDVLEVQKIYSNKRDNDYASYSTSGGATLYQRESPIDQRHSDQNIHASYHNNAMVSVSHSMT